MRRDSLRALGEHCCYKPGRFRSEDLSTSLSKNDFLTSSPKHKYRLNSAMPRQRRFARHELSDAAKNVPCGPFPPHPQTDTSRPLGYPVSRSRPSSAPALLLTLLHVRSGPRRTTGKNEQIGIRTQDLSNQQISDVVAQAPTPP